MSLDLIKRLRELSSLEEGWYANVGRRTGEACCKAMREAAEALTSKDEEIERLREQLADAIEPSPYCDVCGSCGTDGCGCTHKCKYALDHPKVIEEITALEQAILELEKELFQLKRD